MDTGTDFIQPEFLNVLFFQQKNLVIYPYIDKKHLRTLELFTAGHSIVDIDSQALNDLKQLIEFEINNTYSQTPNIYFISDLNEEKVKDIMEIENVRCVLNSHGDIKHLANGGNFIFYNKKNKQFANLSQDDLSFEKQLIGESKNEVMLQDKIQRIKSAASCIFTEANLPNSNFETVKEILGIFDQKYWNKIFSFAERYHNFKIPKEFIKKLIEGSTNKTKNANKTIELPPKFIKEYEFVFNTNKIIGKEFIQLLHKYISEHVNTANLGLDQLFQPKDLYAYLRTHHWKQGISEEFVVNWLKMENTGYKLKDNDITDFETIFKKLHISEDLIFTSIDKEFEEDIPSPTLDGFLPPPTKSKAKKTNGEMPSVKDFDEFRKWILDKLEKLDALLKKT